MTIVPREIAGSPKQVVTELAYRELCRATELHPDDFNSRHEGYAVILEELDELWDEIKAKRAVPERMREEAIQVAAMALRFVLDVCPPPPSCTCTVDGRDSDCPDHGDVEF